MSELRQRTGVNPNFHTPRSNVASVALSVVTFLLVLVVSLSGTIALAFASFTSLAPVSLVRWRQRQRAAELRELWPEVADNLASGVRAGLSLPEALTQIGVRGPEALRRPFQRFGEDYRCRLDQAVTRDSHNDYTSVKWPFANQSEKLIKKVQVTDPAVYAASCVIDVSRRRRRGRSRRGGGHHGPARPGRLLHRSQ